MKPAGASSANERAVSASLYPEEITIRGLAELIVRMSGRDAEISCDPEKPGGPDRRTCDARKASQILGFTPSVSLEKGLAYTIEYFRRRIPCP